MGNAKDILTYFIATARDRGWQRNEDVLLLHRFLPIDILVAFSILRFGKSCEKRFVSSFEAVEQNLAPQAILWHALDVPQPAQSVFPRLSSLRL